MENHMTLFHYIYYFLYKFGQKHSDSLVADPGVGAGGRQSLGSCFQESQAGLMEEEGR